MNTKSILAFLVLSTTTVYGAGNCVVKKVERADDFGGNPFEKVSITVETSQNDSYTAAMYFKKLQIMMKHLGVEKIEALEGKEFEADEDDPLNDLWISSLYEGKVPEPSLEDVLNQVASQLSLFECPSNRGEFSGQFPARKTSRVIYNAIMKEGEKTIVDRLKSKVKSASHGSVTLVDEDPEQSTHHPRGQVTFLKATNGKLRLSTIMGGFMPPIQCNWPILEVK